MQTACLAMPPKIDRKLNRTANSMSNTMHSPATVISFQILRQILVATIEDQLKDGGQIIE